MRYAPDVVNGKMRNFGVRIKERNRMYMQDKLGNARGIGFAIAIAIAIMVALWRLIPHGH